MTTEPCMCGATDCLRCYPEGDEDSPTDAELREMRDEWQAEKYQQELDDARTTQFWERRA